MKLQFIAFVFLGVLFQGEAFGLELKPFKAIESRLYKSTIHLSVISQNETPIKSPVEIFVRYTDSNSDTVLVRRDGNTGQYVTFTKKCDISAKIKSIPDAQGIVTLANIPGKIAKAMPEKFAKCPTKGSNQKLTITKIDVPEYPGTLYALPMMGFSGLGEFLVLSLVKELNAPDTFSSEKYRDAVNKAAKLQHASKFEYAEDCLREEPFSFRLTFSNVCKNFIKVFTSHVSSMDSAFKNALKAHGVSFLVSPGDDGMKRLNLSVKAIQSFQHKIQAELIANDKPEQVDGMVIPASFPGWKKNADLPGNLKRLKAQLGL